jgi:hypothetical protein
VSFHVNEPLDLEEGADEVMIIDFAGADVTLNTYTLELRDRPISDGGQLLAHYVFDMTSAPTGRVSGLLAGNFVTLALHGAVWSLKEVTPGLPNGDVLANGSVTIEKKVTQ